MQILPVFSSSQPLAITRGRKRLLKTWGLTADSPRCLVGKESILFGFVLSTEPLLPAPITFTASLEATKQLNYAAFENFEPGKLGSLG